MNKLVTLTAVELVCGGHPLVSALPHVAATIDAFLWTCTLESASERGLVSRLDALLENEWPGFDRQCREVRRSRAVNKALRSGCDVRVVKWWCTRYMSDEESVPMAVIYEAGIKNAHLPVLDWIYEATKGDLPRLTSSAFCRSPDTMAWLLVHGDVHSCCGMVLPRYWTSETCFQSIQRCFIHEDETESFTIHYGEYAVDEALAHGRPEDLQWLLQHRPQFFEPGHKVEFTKNLNTVNLLSNAVRYGNLDAAKWLATTFPLHAFKDPCQTFEESVEGLGPPRPNLAMVRWVLEQFQWRKQRNRSYWLCEARDHAARSGNIEMLEFVHKIRRKCFKRKEAADKALRRWDEARSPVMDEAAAAGHLDILKVFHSLCSRRYTTNAMDAAAGNGHLDVVQWLHENRSKGCTAAAMDAAGGNGHLDVVQWLQENRSEGCTVKAMDLAAANGHLEMVQWLHTNRSEGATTKAMDAAAANGHLGVVQFLHANRQEGCTSDALLYAASNGHAHTFKWLYENRSEALAPEWMHDMSIDHARVLKYLALYTKHDCLDWFVHELGCYYDFGAIELVLSRSDATQATAVERTFAGFAIYKMRITSRMDFFKRWLLE